MSGFFGLRFNDRLFTVFITSTKEKWAGERENQATININFDGFGVVFQFADKRFL